MTSHSSAMRRAGQIQYFKLQVAQYMTGEGEFERTFGAGKVARRLLQRNHRPAQVRHHLPIDQISRRDLAPRLTLVFGQKILGRCDTAYDQIGTRESPAARA